MEKLNDSHHSVTIRGCRIGGNLEQAAGMRLGMEMVLTTSIQQGVVGT
jgi:hypothetical protein